MDWKTNLLEKRTSTTVITKLYKTLLCHSKFFYRSFSQLVNQSTSPQILQVMSYVFVGLVVWQLGRWTNDGKVVGLTPGRVAIKWLLLGWVGDCLRTGKPSRYITNHQGQLSLPSLRRRQIKYQHVWLGLRWGTFTCMIHMGGETLHCSEMGYQ